jgi:hypothetical protein
MCSPHPAYVFALPPKLYPVGQAIKGCELLKIYPVGSFPEETEMPIAASPLGIAQHFENEVLALVLDFKPAHRSE